MGMIGPYRGSAKWAAFTGSCLSRRSIWTASATQLLAMPRIIVSDRIVTSGSGQSGAFCGLPSTFLSVCHLLLPVLTRSVVYAQTSPAVRQHVAAYGNQFSGLHDSRISRNTTLSRSLDLIRGPG